MIPDLLIKKNYKDAIIPTKAYLTDSGFDLYAYSFDKHYYCDNEIERYTCYDDSLDRVYLDPFDRLLVNTGISATVGEGYEIQIRPKSGLALKNGLTVLNTPGTVDESYTGDICVILVNLSGIMQIVEKHMKVAQLVVCPITLSKIKVVKDFKNTDRGSNGFGSTGL
jgi:dUTP pyrophosphatase